MSVALLVIDMQNAFLHKDGEAYYPDAPKVIPSARQLINAAEKGGHVIVHVADVHRPGFADFEQIHLPEHGIDGGDHAAFHEGFGPAGRDREIIMKKRRYSAFFATDLALFLREQAIHRVVICGVKTNVCVRATAQDAFAHGFEVCVVRDAVNTNRTNLGEASLEDIERYIGRVIGLDQALECLA